MNPRRSIRRASALALVAFASAALTLGSVAPASADADTTTHVYPSDLGATNVSSASFDGMASTPFTALPPDGSKWVLDVEDKPQGSYSMVGDGLELSGVAGGTTKIRFQYYIGSGGYPAIDAQAGADGIPLSSFVQGLSWSIRYPSGPPTLGGATIEFRMQKKISDGVYHRASGYVQCPSTPTTSFETQDLSNCDWRVNSRYLNGTYTAGQWDYFNNAFGDHGGMAQFLSDFSGYSLVSFGPNNGRSALVDGTYIVNSLTALGSTFTFSPEKTAPAAPPVANSDDLTSYLDSKDVTPDTITTPVDPAKPFDKTVPWTSPDGWVDVYGYSTPVFLGTFPVVGGVVQLSGIDLSAFSSGTHHLVLIGQTSGGVAAYSMDVASAGASTDTASLAFTGANDPTVPTLIAGGLLAFGIALAGFGQVARRRRRAQHD